MCKNIHANCCLLEIYVSDNEFVQIFLVAARVLIEEERITNLKGIKINMRPQAKPFKICIISTHVLFCNCQIQIV